MIKSLRKDEIRSYHSIYRNDDLFKHWFSILSVNRKHTNNDPVSIWFMSQNVIEILREDNVDRAEMVEFIIDNMLRNYQHNDVVAVMCVVFTRLANATEKGSEGDEHPNDPICVAIYKYFVKDLFFEGLLKKVLSKKVDNYGKEVVLTPNDPLICKQSEENIPQHLHDEMENMYKEILEKTSPLKALFKNANFEKWALMWSHICHNNELLELLKNVSPRKNDWNLNQKLVLNILGMFNKYLELNIPTSSLNNCLMGKNISSYINNYLSYGTNDSVLTAEILNKIKGFI